MEKFLVSTDVAAETLDIGVTKLYELINAGAIPTVRIGRSVKVPVAALQAWVERQYGQSQKADVA